MDRKLKLPVHLLGVRSRGIFALELPEHHQPATYVKWGENVNIGTTLKAYGAYEKINDMTVLSFCDSKDFFILTADDTILTTEQSKKF